MVEAHRLGLGLGLGSANPNPNPNPNPNQSTPIAAKEARCIGGMRTCWCGNKASRSHLGTWLGLGLGLGLGVRVRVRDEGDGKC